MKGSNVLAIVLGVLVIIGGIYCVMTPTATYMSLAWLLGLVMVVDGVANIVTWFQLRKDGLANGWALLGAIVSVVFGVIVLGSFAMQFAIDLFFAYMVAAWLIVTGVMRIGFGWQMRKLNKALQSQMIGRHWWLVLAAGVLVVILGILCLFNPVATMAGIGLLIGISIIFAGISVVSLAL